MTTVPGWLEAAVREFGAGMGLGDLSLGPSGAAALRFADGTACRLEYAMGFLVMSMSVDSPGGSDAAKLLLSASDPLRRGAFRLRAGTVGNPPRAVFAVRFGPAEGSPGNLESAMAELWRAAENHRRRVGA